MMKTTKKLSLNRETLRNLDKGDLKRAAGGFLSIVKCGGGGVPSGKYTCEYLCTSPGVCVQPSEDCQTVTTMP